MNQSPSGKKGFFRRYKYQILIPLVLFAIVLAVVFFLSLNNDSPFTYATF